jgi:GAF domain-containing protein
MQPHGSFCTPWGGEIARIPGPGTHCRVSQRPRLKGEKIEDWTDAASSYLTAMNVGKSSDPWDGSRYRALLGVSTAIASQPDVHAVLYGISPLLSKIVPFDTITLLLLNPNCETAQLYALESHGHDHGVPVGTEVPYGNTAIVKVLDEQPPILVDTREELQKIPQLAQTIRLDGVRYSDIFPVSSSKRKLGVLMFGSAGHEHFSTADIELMGSVAAHVSVALESALALESAEVYRRDLE